MITIVLIFASSNNATIDLKCNYTFPAFQTIQHLHRTQQYVEGSQSKPGETKADISAARVQHLEQLQSQAKAGEPGLCAKQGTKNNGWSGMKGTRQPDQFIVFSSKHKTNTRKYDIHPIAPAQPFCAPTALRCAFSAVRLSCRCVLPHSFRSARALFYAVIGRPRWSCSSPPAWPCPVFLYLLVVQPTMRCGWSTARRRWPRTDW